MSTTITARADGSLISGSALTRMATPMTALPGGAADKAGNRYEDLWTALRVADLLRGDVSYLHLEPAGASGAGVEFLVGIDGNAWGEQAKSTMKHWTVHQLATEGVLGHIKTQREQGSGYRLVAAAGSEPLEWLAHRARSSDSFEDFQELALRSARRRGDFDRMTEAWDVTPERAWHLLVGVEVDHRPLASLEREVAAAIRLLVVEDADEALAAIRDLCTDHIHQRLTAVEAWRWLEGRLTRRLIRGDASVPQRLHASVERHAQRVSRSASELGLVPREDADTLVETIVGEGPAITILDGPAGAGKSSVVADVADRLEADGWNVAITSMDGTTRGTTTARQLGEAAGFGESPTVLLAGLAEDGPTLLVVEQLDAVSVYGGRMSDNFDAVAELLDEAARAPNVHVLLVVRSVDLAGDPRLRGLSTGDGVKRHTVGLLDADRVRAHLDEHDIEVPDQQTLELLRTPLHLSVYARLSASARAQGPQSLQQLYAAYTQELRLKVEKQHGTLDWAGIVTPLVTYMSDNERLLAPEAVVDHADRSQLKALESASVLIREGNQLRFFHESYFDYLFARAFVADGRDVHDFLAESGQYLFRRAQTRQLLDYLAATDEERFRTTVVQLLTSTDIRPHLKEVVITVLREHTATAEDWRALDAIAWDGSPTAGKVQRLLSRPQWFDAADAAGCWEGWFAEPATVDDAFTQLIIAARERGQRCTELLAPYVGTSEEWRQRLRALIQWSLNGELAGLAIDLIERGHLDDATGPIAVNSTFWSIVYRLLKDDPAAAAHVTGAWLRRGLARARADGAADPFASGHLDRYGQDGRTIMEVAESAPREFLTSVLPFVMDAATTDPRSVEGSLPQGPWWYRSVGEPHGVADAVLHGCLAALRDAAEGEPEAFIELLDSFRWMESDELRFLACHAQTAAVEAGSLAVTAALDWLLSDERNLSLGWVSAPHDASRHLVAACATRADTDELERLTDAILGYEPGVPGEPSWMYGQFVLLSGVPEAKRSASVQRRLGELQRRFDADEPPPPQPMEAHLVGSPIPTDSARKMSDEDWLRALRTHNEDRTDWRGDRPVGGARELASTLGEVAGGDPERFAALAMRFASDIPPAAIENVIRSIGEHISVESLTDVCLHAYDMHGSAVGRAVCSAVQRKETATEALAELVAGYAADPDPDRELARISAGGTDGAPYYGGDLASAGLNCTRGAAAVAISRLLFRSDDYVELFTPVLDRLARDDILAVRVSAAHAVGALARHDPAVALDMTEALFDTATDVLDANSTQQLLQWAVVHEPSRFVEVADAALHAGPAISRRAGRVWAVADHHGALEPPLPETLGGLPTAARTGAAEVLAANARDSVEALVELFADADAEVRQAAGRVWWRVENLPPDRLEELTAGYIDSPALEDGEMDGVVRVYAGLAGRLPQITLELCRRIIEVAGTDLGDIRTARAGVSPDLLSLILRLYRQSGPESRRHCLDLIDQLVELGAYGVDDALREER